MVPRCAPSVLFALADYRFLDYMLWPSVATMAVMTASETTIRETTTRDTTTTTADSSIMEMAPQAQRKRGPSGDDDVQDDMAAAPSAAATSAKQPVVRKYFPEMWLWHSAAVAYASPSPHFPSAPLLHQPLSAHFPSASLLHQPLSAPSLPLLAITPPPHTHNVAQPIRPNEPHTAPTL